MASVVWFDLEVIISGINLNKFNSIANQAISQFGLLITIKVLISIIVVDGII